MKSSEFCYLIGRGGSVPPKTEPSPAVDSGRGFYRIRGSADGLCIESHGDGWHSEWWPKFVSVKGTDFNQWARHRDLPSLLLAIAQTTSGSGLSLTSKLNPLQITVGFVDAEGIVDFRRDQFRLKMASTQVAPLNFQDLIHADGIEPFCTTNRALVKDALDWIQRQMSTYSRAPGTWIESGKAWIHSLDGGAMVEGLDAFPRMWLLPDHCIALRAWVQRVSSTHVTFHECMRGDQRMVLITATGCRDRFALAAPTMQPNAGQLVAADPSDFWVEISVKNLHQSASLARLATEPDQLARFETAERSRGTHLTMTAPFELRPTKPPLEITASCGFACQLRNPKPPVFIHPRALMRSISAHSVKRVSLALAHEGALLVIDDVSEAPGGLRARSWLRASSQPPALH